MLIDDDTSRAIQKSHLFTLRFWREDLGNGRADWRGKAQHITSGEVRYFREWSVLKAFLEEMLYKMDEDTD